MLLAAIVASGCTPSPHDLVARGELDALRARLVDTPELVDTRNDLGKTPLHYAVTFDQFAMLEILVEAGADVNAADATGMTPLHVAAALNRGELARWLIEAGAAIEATDAFGDTPLHTACMFGATDAISVLVRSGAALEPENHAGLSPTALARKHRRTALADQLDAYIARKKS